MAATLFALPTVVTAQVPRMIHYQGRVVETTNGTPYSGTGYFKFALVDAGGATSYWSNDGTSVAGSEPTNSVPLKVSDGVYSVSLGKPTLSGMTMQIPPVIFQNTVVYLRLWFATNSAGPFALATPDRRIVSVGYAMNAATVVDGAIDATKLSTNAITADAITNGAVTTDKLADKAVTTGKLNDGSVTSTKLADDIYLGSSLSAGELQLSDGSSLEPGSVSTSITLDGAAGTVSASDALVVSKTQSLLGSSVTTTQAVLSAEADGGHLHLYDANQKEVASLGVSPVGGGKLKVYQEDGTSGASVIGDRVGGNSGGAIEVNNGDTQWRVYISGGPSGGAGEIRILDAVGTNGITLNGQDSGGNARITTQVLEITGGGDLSENFDVSAMSDSPEPGMVVCIDSNHPGRLKVSSKAYDPMVAGIMSGAGGIKPGLLMGQHGTMVNGKHPVALSGRVYCYADASNGAIHPGDLLTTSDVPGDAMKVTDHAKAQGAIIGKAMTGLSDGKGFVLVLVSLQ